MKSCKKVVKTEIFAKKAISGLKMPFLCRFLLLKIIPNYDTINMDKIGAKDI